MSRYHETRKPVDQSKIEKLLKAGWNPAKIASYLSDETFFATGDRVKKIAREIGIRINGDRNEMNVYFGCE